MNLSNVRSQVLKLAHQIRKAGQTFGEAQRKAWYIFKLRQQMKNGTAQFQYIKKGTGEVRQAEGTLNIHTNTTSTTRTARKNNPIQIKYFDLMKNSWRSFNAANILL